MNQESPETNGTRGFEDGLHWHRFIFAFLIVLFLFQSRMADAMDFRTYYQPNLRINVLIAEGSIVAGDAQRFLAMVPKGDRDAEGHIVLVLNSPGGSIPAAFELVQAMDKVGVFTIVPDNAICASACASIIYPSGIRRNIVGTGRLGFHSCYVKIGNVIEESAFCNQMIAEHAVSRGVAHASVNLFVNDFGAHDMAWVDRKIACSMLIGMCRPTLRESSQLVEFDVRPSFDCLKARTLVEKLICVNPKLAKMDAQMAIAYFTLRTTVDNVSVLLNEQRRWLKERRNKCEDIECINDVYQSRIQFLKSRLN